MPAWTRTIVCLCPSAPIGRACALAMLAHEPARIRLVYSSTSPPSCIRPSVHPSIRQSVSPGSVHPFPYDLSFSLFRRREPKTNLALAGQPVPRARQTEAPRDSHTCRQTRLGLGRKGRSLTLRVTSLLQKDRLGRSCPLGPQSHSSEPNPGSRVLLTTSHSCQDVPQDLSAPNAEIFSPPCFFFWKENLGTLDKKGADGAVGCCRKEGGGHPLADPSSPLKINSFCCFLFPSRFLFSLLPSLSTPSLFL